MDQAMQDAVRILGSKVALARAAGVTKQAVHLWTRIPPRYVRSVSAATGIPRSVIRPDIYPPDEEPAARTAA